MVFCLPLVQSCHINRMGLHVQPGVPRGLGQFFHGSHSWSWTWLSLVKNQEFSLIATATGFRKILINWGQSITEINSQKCEFPYSLFQEKKKKTHKKMKQKPSSITHNNNIFAVLQCYIDIETMYWIEYIYVCMCLILFSVLWATILCYERIIRI